LFGLLFHCMGVKKPIQRCSVGVFTTAPGTRLAGRRSDFVVLDLLRRANQRGVSHRPGFDFFLLFLALLDQSLHRDTFNAFELDTARFDQKAADAPAQGPTPSGDPNVASRSPNRTGSNTPFRRSSI
jgi:hypothetical protein